MFRLATSILSPGGARGRLSAFIFHRVLPAPDPLQPSEPHAEQFDEMLGWIGSQFNVLPPLEACERLYAKSLPPRAAIITFDDGYRDNHDIALPLLRKHGMSAAFFVATGFLGGGAMFNDRVIEAIRCAPGPELDAAEPGSPALPLATDADRRAAIEILIASVKHAAFDDRCRRLDDLEAACGVRARPDLMMREVQVAALARAGMVVGGHTRNHPILCVLDEASARGEIEGGRDDLRAITGQPPRMFAYPNGKIHDDFERVHRGMVEAAGFSFAFTTHGGASLASDDPLLLRRHTPWSRTALRFKGQALSNLAAGASEPVFA